MAEPKGKAFQTVQDTAPRNTYRGAVVGCGRMGSTIDDEHIGMPITHGPGHTRLQ